MIVSTLRLDSELKGYCWEKAPVPKGMVDNYLRLKLQVPKEPEKVETVLYRRGGGPNSGPFIRGQGLCVRGVLDKVFGDTLIPQGKVAKDVVSKRMEVFAIWMQRRSWLLYIWKVGISRRVSYPPSCVVRLIACCLHAVEKAYRRTWRVGCSSEGQGEGGYEEVVLDR
jgi:hypothetical protein